MKVLRAIGGFFAKIGRWIASTAWIQPLLIVGGIFGIIFSIPYIKKGIEGLQTDTTDYNYKFYSDRALTLSEGGQADKLLSYLEDFENKKDNIKSEFASKFFLVFAKKDCPSCKEDIPGFKNFASNFSKWKKDPNYNLDGNFKLYSILVDKTDDDGNYLAKKIVSDHQQLFDDLAADYGEDGEDYPLFNNLPNKKSDLMSRIQKFQDLTSEQSDGIETPTVFMVDVDGAATNFSVNGITQVFFNYVELMDSDIYDETNATTKGQLLRDCWAYKGVFDPDYKHNQ